MRFNYCTSFKYWKNILTYNSNIMKQEKAEIIFKKDWDQICAMLKWKENLATDPVWFWKTENEARKNLVEQINDKKPYWVRIILYTEISEERHELAMVELRSKQRFTNKIIEDFIAWDDFIKNIKENTKKVDTDVKIFYVFVNSDE